jgi:hypothetical protein
MNGPNHFREALRLIALVELRECQPYSVADTIAAAQVHATLALVASVAELVDASEGPDGGAWAEVLG